MAIIFSTGSGGRIPPSKRTVNNNRPTRKSRTEIIIKVSIQKKMALNLRAHFSLLFFFLSFLSTLFSESEFNLSSLSIFSSRWFYP